MPQKPVKVIGTKQHGSFSFPPPDVFQQQALLNLGILPAGQGAFTNLVVKDAVSKVTYPQRVTFQGAEQFPDVLPAAKGRQQIMEFPFQD